MANQFDDEKEEAPLDPAMQRVQVKLRRMMLISGSTLGVGLLAVIFAIIYKVSHLGPTTASGAPFNSHIEIPAGSTILSSEVAGDRVIVTLDGPGGRSIRVYELTTGISVGVATFVAR